MKTFGRLIISLIFAAVFVAIAVISILAVTNNGVVSLSDVIKNLSHFNDASGLGDNFKDLGTTNIIALVAIIFSGFGLLFSILAIFFKSFVKVMIFFGVVALGLGGYVAYRYFGHWPSKSELQNFWDNLQHKTNVTP